MFPKITHISDLTKQITGDEFGVYPNENGTTVVCYAIADRNTFRGDNSEFKRECRGITFYEDGSVAARPLHKFFNVGENEESMPHNIPWDKIVRISTKHDGSMVMPIKINGQIVFKTKRSFDSKEALSAGVWLRNRPDLYTLVGEWLSQGLTPVFEWVSPESPIVLTTYTEPELILLQVRVNESGSYLDLTDGEVLAALGISVDTFRVSDNHIEKFMVDGVVSWDLLSEAAKTTTGEEGWVIQTKAGSFWKIKTAWYILLHHNVTFVRVRDVVRSICGGMYDDLYSYLMAANKTHDLAMATLVYNNVIDFRDNLRSTIDNYVLMYSGMHPSEVVVKLKRHPLQLFVMRELRGVRTTDEALMAYILKNHIQDYSLTPLLNITGVEDIKLATAS